MILAELLGLSSVTLSQGGTREASRATGTGEFRHFVNEQTLIANEVNFTSRLLLQEKVKALTAEVAGARREITTLQAALEEAQTRLAAAADKYKNENDRYRRACHCKNFRLRKCQLLYANASRCLTLLIHISAVSHF